jgi:hypothetical protein
MSNHYHILLKTRPDLTDLLSDSEIATRWLQLCPPHLKNGVITNEILQNKIANLADDKRHIATLRERLGSLSWFMKTKP